MRVDDAGRAHLLFLDQGYAGARIGDITDRCGISRTGSYTCFRGKREVFRRAEAERLPRGAAIHDDDLVHTLTRFVVGMLDAGRPPVGR
ncbi:TetR family transcriptional regulator [Pseudonocardia parietis]|uniref:AcrR family transcriptional regulator n=1 Tax=Pseudonocardia parietis TaxID=570936 RepID=A0ABS4W0L7_9PSEU|nr:TetR family transcriptional regulator [Pseudonocardia parietis]MBP2369757.1 AcrR family transcriptional regulator [Pseudonocardia parietis]